MDWQVIEKIARNVLDKKWLSNHKQKVKASNQPHGHSFEAVAHSSSTLTKEIHITSTS